MTRRRSFFSRLLSSNDRAAAPARGRRTARLAVEALEDRSVPATLTLSIPAASMSEAAGPNAVGALLNRTGDLSQPLTVTLVSSDTSEATVPASVSFAAGQQEVGFSISAVDDAILDGTQRVTITATANVTQGQQPFGFDLSYGNGGQAPTRMDMHIQPPVAAIAVQRDGKVVVASENNAGNGWHVQRFLSNGTLDTSFGGGLVNTTDLGGGFPVPHKAFVLPDGDILIGGKVSSGTGAGILVRYNPNGTLDTGFGVGGQANLSPLGTSWVTDIAVRPDGRILLGLAVNGTVTTRVAQLNPNGTFDSTFGTSGIRNLNLGFTAEQVELLADGTFLVGGSFRMPVFVAKVQPNGNGLVTSFGTNGLASLDFGRQGSRVAGMEVDTTGRIVIGGDVFDFVNGNSTPADYAVGRLNPNGSPDTSFAGDGTAIIDAGGGELSNALVLQQDGKVIVGGRTSSLTNSSLDSSMARFTAAGLPDTTFDGDGVFRQSLIPPTSFSPDQIMNMALQDDGKLLALAGWATDQRINRFHLGPQNFTLTSSDVIDVLDNEVANGPPVAENQSVTTAEDTARNGNVVATDPDGNTLTYAVVNQPANGSLSFNPATGAFTYTPNANYNGADSFTFKANDGLADSNVATVSITVTPVNDAPVAAGFQFGTDEDTPLNERLRGSDIDGDPLTFALLSQPSQGTVQITNASTGAFTYTPPLNFNGTVSFDFKVNDGTVDSAPARVFITVRPVNDAPVAADDSKTVAEDAPATAIDVRANDSDVDGDPLTITAVTQPANGSVAIAGGGTGLTYQPAPNFNGTDAFSYTISDGRGGTDTATVTVTVTPVNDAPVAQGQSISTNEDTPTTGQLVATDVDSATLTYAAVAGPANGTLTVNPNGTFTYTPSANYHGLDSFTFKANDGLADSNVATVSITVTPVNDAPDAVNDLAATDEDTAVAVAVLGNDTDVDGDTLTVSAFTQGANGSVTVNATGTLTYTPAANFNGTDSFTYTVSDGNGGTDTATVTVTVQPVNDAPVAAPGSATTPEDQAVSGTVTASDADGDQPQFLLVSGPQHGSVTLSLGGSFTYTPAPDYHGPDSFTFKANDGSADSNVATVSITVTPVNDAPVAADDSYTTQAGAALQVAAPGVLGNDTDVDGDALQAVVVTGPAHGTLTLNANGSFAYTAAAGFSGTDSFTYRASDGSLDDLATVTISVSPSAAATEGKVTGNGSMDRGARRFSVNVQSRLRGGELSFSGQLSFEDRQNNLRLESTSITYLRVESDGVRATIRGTATVNGVSGYTFTVTVEDHGEPGRNDTFRIVISGPNGYAYDSIDFALLGGLLETGNLQVHKK